MRFAAISRTRPPFEIKNPQPSSIHTSGTSGGDRVLPRFSVNLDVFAAENYGY